MNTVKHSSPSSICNTAACISQQVALQHRLAARAHRWRPLLFSLASKHHPSSCMIATAPGYNLPLHHAFAAKPPVTAPTGSAISWHCPIAARPSVTAVLFLLLHRVLGALEILVSKPLFLPILPSSTIPFPVTQLATVVTVPFNLPSL